jgi:hypothetical protein
LRETRVVSFKFKAGGLHGGKPMAKRWNGSCILACLLTMMASGCCCTQGRNTCNSYSSCPTGGCGAGPLMQMSSCRGGCGEVYVDEWFNHPPCADDCGYSNCSCGQCRPIRSVLRALWGTPYIAPGCDSCGSYAAPGCSSCDGGGVVTEGHVGGSSCNCGGNHGSNATHKSAMPNPGHSQSPAEPHAKPSEAIEVPSPNAPTPAPVTASSAKRLSPVKQKMAATRASTN